MSDFSYQKITTTAVTAVLRLGRRARAGWGMAAACSISLCRNNVPPYKGLPCWNKSPLEALQLLNALWGWWLWMGDMPWTAGTAKAPPLAQQLLLEWLPRSPLPALANPPVPTEHWGSGTPSAILLETGKAPPRHRFHAILSIILQE